MNKEQVKHMLYQKAAKAISTKKEETRYMYGEAEQKLKSKEHTK